MCVMFIFDLMLVLLAIYLPEVQADCMGGDSIKVRLHANAVPVVDILQSVTLPEECSLLVDPQVQGQLSLDLQTMPWFDAITMVGLLQHLSIDRWHNVVLVREEKNKARKPPLVRRKVELKHASAEQVMAKVSQYLKAWSFKQGRVFPTKNGRNLIVYEQVEHMQALVDLIESLDVKPTHIQLTGKLMYIEDELIHALGLNWGNVMGWHIALPGLHAHGLTLRQLRPEALLVFERSEKVTVVARPILVTLSGIKASIESGEQIPYQEKVSESGLGIRFKKAVLKLTIKPTELADGRIHLEIELNQDQVSPRMVQGVPSIQTQHLQTELTAKSGETVMLGGVYRLSKGETYKGLPRGNVWQWLLRLLGEHGDSQKQEQLLMILTPKII